MRMALEEGRRGTRDGDEPFAACIVRGARVVSIAHNTFTTTQDPTAHAEVNAIRKACAKLGRGDLTGCTLYTTNEPCAMCFAACHYAKVSTIVYGAKRQDIRKFGFKGLISVLTMKRLYQNRVAIIRHVLRDECVQNFETWAARRKSKQDERRLPSG